MVVATHLSKNLRKSLLLKVISKSTPTNQDIETVLELTATKVIEDMRAQSMTIYLLDGNEISFRYIYYSPTIWGNNTSIQKKFEEKREKLLKLTLPQGTGIVGRVIKSGEANFFNVGAADNNVLYNLSKATDFNVNAMLTVPMKTKNRVIGAIQVLNKEPGIEPQTFEENDRIYLTELAEYTAPLLMRHVDPSYQMDDDDTAKYISRFTDTRLITDFTSVEFDETFVKSFDPRTIAQFLIMPVKRVSDGSILALMTNPLDYQSREAFAIKTQYQIDETFVTSKHLINACVKKFFADTKESDEESHENTGEQLGAITDKLSAEYAQEDQIIVEQDEESVKDDASPIVALVNKCIEDAYFSGASDIHVEPQDNRVVIRYRIDGLCIEKMVLPKNVIGALVARIKIMCDLDIAQKRLPQDGRIAFAKYTKSKINIDLRVATCPTLYGEKVVMRLLDKSRTAMPIDSLGFSEANLVKYRSIIQSPYGMILHCGPTGSGKSMTLFSAISEVMSPMLNVQTAEDPIEYTVAGINQVQMHKAIGLTFASALRSFLRMDPDIILVGEIRDKETAEIAIEAALTGHLLLSTIHTNDAPSTIVRFTDMDIEPFMISSSLLLVCAQRLIRRVCKKCRVKYMPNDGEIKILQHANVGWNGQEIYKNSEHGCQACGGSGMRGRIGIHELMENNEDITRSINRGASTAEIKEVATKKNGMKTLHQDSILKVIEGTSTLVEAISNISPD